MSAKKKSIILVESALNVLKLIDSSIFNCVAMFGCELSGRQREQIMQLGISNIIIATDNDEAGIAARERIQNKLGRHYQTKFVEFNTNDIAELSSMQIRKIFNE